MVVQSTVGPEVFGRVGGRENNGSRASLTN